MDMCKTVEEVKEMLGVTTPTVYKLLREGKLVRAKGSRDPSKQTGRLRTMVTVGSVVAYIKNN